MTLPLWGQLQKAQDDSESIEDAITRLIAVHESDPEAHLGDGESLAAHKSSDVIDHPPGSLLPDKVSVSDFQFDTTFESLSGFTIVGSVTGSSWPGASFSIYDGGHDVASLRANLVGLLTGSSLSYDVLFDVYFYLDTSDSLEIINVGNCNTTYTTLHYGLRISGGHLYGFARWGGSEHLTSSLGAVDSGSIQFARFFYDHGAGVVYFFLNGAQVGTLQPASAISTDNQFCIRGLDNGAESTIFRVFRLTFSRSI